MVENIARKPQGDFLIPRISTRVLPGIPKIDLVKSVQLVKESFSNYLQQHPQFDNISHALFYGTLVSFIADWSLNDLEANYQISKSIPGYIIQALPYLTGMLTAMYLPEKNKDDTDYDKPHVKEFDLANHPVIKVL